MTRWRRWAWTALVVLGWGSAGCGRAENSLLLLQDQEDLDTIEFEGNERFDDKTLRNLMTLHTGSWWNPFGEHKFREGQLESDIRAILTHYRRHGYLRADVVDRQILRDGGKVRLTLRILEGTPVTVGEVGIHGARVLDPEKLRGKLGLSPGKPMDPFRMEEDRLLILRELADRGHWKAAVDAGAHLYGDTAVVLYGLDEGEPVYIRDIAPAAPLHRYPERVFRREIVHDPGDLLRLRDLRESQNQLLTSGYFLDARWDTTAYDSSEGKVSVHWNLRERTPRWLEFGVGVTSQENFRVSGEWGTRNLFGAGLRTWIVTSTELDLGDRIASVLDEHRTDLIATFPHLLGTRWEGRPSVFYAYDNDVIDLAGGAKGNFSQDIYGVGFSVRYRLRDFRNQVVVSLDNRWVHNDADSAARASDPQLFRERYTTRLLTVRLDRDHRSDLFTPSSGGYQNVLLEIAGGALGGNNAFQKVTAGGAAFTRAPILGAVLAGRIEGGFIWPQGDKNSVAGQPVASDVELVPSEDRYRLGGTTTVRGFQTDELDGNPGNTGPEGGLVEMLFNVEARIPIFGRLSAVLFLDAGNVWPEAGMVTLDGLLPHTNRAEVSPRDLRYTYGAGLRFDTPLGPIRLDLPQKWNIPLGVDEAHVNYHVSIGHAF